jgi:tetratricopeptide (TPR) repeat protein
MAPEAPHNDAADSATSAAESGGGKSQGGLVRRLGSWAKQHRLKAALLMLSGLTSLGMAIVLFLVMGTPEPEPKVTLPQALQALDEGRLADARNLATVLRDSLANVPEQLGGPAFVLGAAAAYEAEQTRSADRKNLYLIASRHLEEARDRGFPPARAAEGLLLLGRSLYLSGQIAASRPILHEALTANPRRRLELRYLLAEAYLTDANPKYDAALEENSLYLAEGGLSVAERQEGLLQRAKALLALGRIEECRETLDQIPASAKNRAEATLLHGRVLLHTATQLPGAAEGEPSAAEVAEFHKRVEEAIAAFRQAEAQDTLNAQVGGKAMYLIGLSFLRLKDYRAALNQFARVEKVHPNTPESLVAGLQEADLARRLGKDREALTRYRQILQNVGDSESFSNPWISLDELRKQIMVAHQQYLNSEQFAFASDLAAHLYPLFPRKQQMEVVARTCRTWGENVLSQAEALPPSKAEEMLKRGREQLRRAGWHFQQLAELRKADREYPDDLWESATCYLAGDDFRNAARQFRDYLKNESRRRRAWALVSLAEALLALDRLDDALSACKECIEFHPRDPAAFSARLLAAHAHIAKGEPEEAEKLLQENLSGEALTPASKEWQDSLFDLGRLLYRQGEYERAIERLREAVQRYPDASRSVEAQYLIADSHRLHARQLEGKLKEDRVENTRVARSRKVRELLTLSLKEFKQLQESLAHRQETDELKPLERLVLRNCYFTIGHILFQLQQYDEAVKAYVMATNRYQSSPEVLDAYVQMARAYRKLSKPAEARGAVEQAKMVLARMKPEVSFKETTNYSLEEWTKLLEEESKG